MKRVIYSPAPEKVFSLKKKINKFYFSSKKKEEKKIKQKEDIVHMSVGIVSGFRSRCALLTAIYSVSI